MSPMKSRYKIAIIHPYLREGGGSESRALWIAEALKNDYDVTMYTMGEPNLEALNAYYGADLSIDQINLLSFPILKVFRNRFDAMRSYKLNRYCQKVSSDYDLMISTYNVMDFGRRGIQFIADFSFHDKLRQLLHPRKGWQNYFYGKSPLRWAYLNLSKILSRTREKGWMRNFTVVNSNWSGKIISDTVGLKTQVVYPPVVGDTPQYDWENRKKGFVGIGRLVPEKGFDTVIEILGKVCHRKQDIHLHILGPLENTKYARQLVDYAGKNKDWVFFEGQKFVDDKMDFILQHKYGISGCINEAFGIAVAEMVKAGMIVWVPNGGGQVEIVNHPMLIYNDIEDAANKIVQVLKDNSLQQEIRKHLKEQSEHFSTERFMNEVKLLVKDFIDGKI